MKPTTKPELDLGSHLVPGLAAVALFAVMAGVFLTAQFPEPQGFPADANITASIGYAMFNLDFGNVPSESFLIAFLIIAIALDAALDGSLILARRERDGKNVSLLADGGRELKRTVFGDDTASQSQSESETDAVDEALHETGGDR
jgi:NADH-quinone oxidoreductase subunit J